MSRYHIVMLVLGACLLTSCSRSVIRASDMPAAAPVEAIIWHSQDGRGFREWGQTDNGLFIVSGNPDLVEMMSWEHGTLKKGPSARMAGLMDAQVLSDGRFLGKKPVHGPEGPYPLILASAPSGEIIKAWDGPTEVWWVTNTGMSRNGKFAAVAIQMDLTMFVGRPAPKEEYRKGFRVGVLDMSSQELKWIDLQVKEISGMGGGGVRGTHTLMGGVRGTHTLIVLGSATTQHARSSGDTHFNCSRLRHHPARSPARIPGAYSGEARIPGTHTLIAEDR